MLLDLERRRGYGTATRHRVAHDLGVNERTVRRRRDRALTALREAGHVSGSSGLMPSTRFRQRPGKGTVRIADHHFVSQRHPGDDRGLRDQTMRVPSGRRSNPDDCPFRRPQSRCILSNLDGSNICTMPGWTSIRRLRPRTAFHRFPSAANYQTCDHPNMTASAGPPPSAAHAAWSRSKGGAPQNSSPLHDSVTDNRTASARSGDADKEAVVRGSGWQPGWVKLPEPIDPSGRPVNGDATDGRNARRRWPGVFASLLCVGVPMSASEVLGAVRPNWRCQPDASRGERAGWVSAGHTPKQRIHALGARSAGVITARGLVTVSLSVPRCRHRP